jgi:peroxiredoxin/outer membrane lipoprotein-sorting protein
MSFRTCRWIHVLLCALICGAGSSALAQAEDAGPPVDAPAKPVLEQFARTLRGFETLQFVMHQEMNTRMEGMRQQMSSRFEVAVERPNRFAIRLTQGMMGTTVVSNGEKLYTYMPMMGRYQVDEAPASLEEFDTGTSAVGPMAQMGAGMFLNIFAANEPKRELLEIVDSIEYVGVEEVDGQPCHRLKLSSEGMNIDAWVTREGRTLPVRVRPDLKGYMERIKQEMPAEMEQMEIEMAFRFEDWKFDEPVPDESFRFEPPDDAEKVDSIIEMSTEGETHPLTGEEAPDFELPRLEGEPVRLSDHEGEHVVILDFWATWCGPCVQAMPVLSEIASDYREQGVVLYAVNQRESAETIRQFLEREDLKVDVLLDKQGEVAEQYEVEGIPQTVIVDQAGRVQAVHVGYGPGAEERLRADLDDVLAGKDLAAETLEADDTAPTATERLEKVWSVDSVDGAFEAVVTDGSTVFAASSDGLVTRVDQDGKKQDEVKFGGRAGALRLANLTGGIDPELISFGEWGPTVTAKDAGGKTLWRYEEGQGINDVWPTDLNGDGQDEVIVGYNGFAGVHALDARGELLWRNQSIGNVWHVCAGDVNDDGQIEVVTTSARGQVHVFDRDGTAIKDLKVPLYANVIRVAPQQNGADLMLAGGPAKNGDQLVALDWDGNVRWTAELSKAAHSIEDIAVDSTGRLIAVSLRGGNVFVIDSSNGKRIGSVGKRGTHAKLAWCMSEESRSLLVIATGRSLHGYRLVPSSRLGTETD